jgi:acyl-CoA-binding protein
LAIAVVSVKNDTPLFGEKRAKPQVRMNYKHKNAARICLASRKNLLSFSRAFTAPQHPTSAAIVAAYLLSTGALMPAAQHTPFEAAVVASKNLPEKPSPPDLLQLYSLYKQATVGDNTEAQPGFTDIVARAKWDAWNKLRGTAADIAMQRYIDTVTRLQQAMGN